MFTALRDTVDSLSDHISTINTLLADKIIENVGALNNADEVDYVPLVQDADRLDSISDKIEPVNVLVVTVNGILDAAQTYLEDLINWVPHYDEVTALSLEADEDPDEVDDDFEPYAQLYLDTLLENVTNEELELYTSDNGKIVHDCRKFIPNATTFLRIVLQMFQQLESLLNNDDLIHQDVHTCCDRINRFTIQFNQFLAKLNM
jgi:hypothetical protein